MAGRPLIRMTGGIRRAYRSAGMILGVLAVARCASSSPGDGGGVGLEPAYASPSCTAAVRVDSPGTSDVVTLGRPEELPWAGLDPPRRRVSLRFPYWLGTYELTNACYRRCVRSGACSPQAVVVYTRPAGQPPYSEDPALSGYPASRLTWVQARDACRFFGGDLPTFAEWEFAARSADGRWYPWGNEARCDRLVTTTLLVPPSTVLECGDENYLAAAPPSPVVRPGASSGPFAASDQLGNVGEWLFDVVSIQDLIGDEASSRALGAVFDPGRMRSAEGQPFASLVGGSHAHEAGAAWMMPLRLSSAATEPGAGVRCLWRSPP